VTSSENSCCVPVFLLHDTENPTESVLNHPLNNFKGVILKGYCHEPNMAHSLNKEFDIKNLGKGLRMKNLIRATPIALILASTFFVSACKEAGNERGPKSAAQTGSKMSNAELEKSIRAKLENDAQLKEAKLSVSVDADKNEVTLSGTVPTQDARARALDLAKSTQPDVTINDKIDVKPASA
jgi:osmotically-inducible protein OsmY